jgi:hypothetical protein
VTCGCRSGQTCLSNGACATPCTLGAMSVPTAGGDVGCSGATTDGQRFTAPVLRTALGGSPAWQGAAALESRSVPSPWCRLAGDVVRPEWWPLRGAALKTTAGDGFFDP